jgi:hypothetical protein
MAKRQKKKSSGPLVAVGVGIALVGLGIGHAPTANSATGSTGGDSSIQTAAKAAKAAGFRGELLVDAVAVAGAESGWKPTATNHNSNGTTDYGEWEINSANPWALKLGEWSNVYDNARMAYKVKQAQGWHAWSTVNNGDYLKYLPQARKAVAEIS